MSTNYQADMALASPSTSAPPGGQLIKTEPNHMITADVGPSQIMDNAPFPSFNQSTTADSSSSSSPNLAQLGLAEFLQDPGAMPMPQPPDEASNSTTTMWEDIASSIKKLDPDHADVLLVASTAPTTTLQQSHFTQSSSTSGNLLIIPEISDHLQQDCTYMNPAVLDAPADPPAAGGGNGFQFNTAQLNTASFDNNSAPYECQMSDLGSVPPLGPHMSAISSVEQQPSNTEQCTLNQYSNIPLKNSLSSSGSSYICSDVSSSSQQAATSKKTADSFKDKSSTIEYKPKYNRRNNPDLEKRRIHFCDHPGKKHKIKAFFESVFATLFLCRLYKGVYEKFSFESASANTHRSARDSKFNLFHFDEICFKERSTDGALNLKWTNLIFKVPKNLELSLFFAMKTKLILYS